MNANVHTAPSELGLSSALSQQDCQSLETPYLAAVDTLRMIVDIVSPSAKLNVVGICFDFISCCRCNESMEV